MSCKADLYIMLPCSIEEEKIVLYESGHEDGELYIDTLSDTAKVEFDSVLSSGIKRHFLGKITLSCYNDLKGNQDAFIIKSRYKDTNFCLLTVAMVNVDVNMITFILDQTSRGDLKIFEENQHKLLYDWIEKFGLKSAGKAFFATYMSELPNAVEVPFILAAEAFYDNPNYRIISDTIKECLNKNHAQYSNNDVYMSEHGIINVKKEYDELPYKDRLEIECTIIFIMELIVLKITAINIANKKVIEYTKKDVSSKGILEILEGFAESLPLWNTQYLKYLIAQEFASRVETSFKVSRYLADYERNRSQLEQIVNIRKLVDAEKNTKAITRFGTITEKNKEYMTFFGTILAVSQIVPFLTPVLSPKVLNIFNLMGFNLEKKFVPLVIFLGLAALAILFFLLMDWKKKKDTNNPDKKPGNKNHLKCLTLFLPKNRK